MMVDRADAAIDAALALGDAAGGDDPVQLYPIVRRLTLDIVVRSMFGPSLAARVDEIEGLFERPQAYLESPAIRQLPHPFPFTRRARVRVDLRALDGIIDAELAGRRARSEPDAGDLLTLLAHDGSLQVDRGPPDNPLRRAP
jgi:cytochrome P450